MCGRFVSSREALEIAMTEAGLERSWQKSAPAAGPKNNWQKTAGAAGPGDFVQDPLNGIASVVTDQTQILQMVPDQAYTVDPGSSALMITVSDREPLIREALWGFPGKDGGLLINARAETAFTKSSFRTSMEGRRCLLAAECFYEWDRSRNKTQFEAPDRRILLLAGIWDLFAEQLRFTVLTVAANRSVIEYHDRMPLIIRPEDAKNWLLSADAAAELIRGQMPRLKAHQEYTQMSLF